MTQKQTSEPKPWFVGEPFEQMVGLLIAIVTLLASVTGYLQVQADGASTKASNQGQQFALQSIGGRARGEILAGYAWSDAYRTWLALDTQAVLSKNAGDAVAAQDFLTARDRISTLTPLLQPPYFDEAAQDYPNLRAYESDLYILETALLRESFLNADAVGSAWGEKSGKYVVHLTMYTVVLFLYSLALTVVGRVRWLFVALSSVMAIATTFWMIGVVLTPVTALPKSAIDAYAVGVALAHQQGYAQAQEAFDEALQIAPDFANALYERANANHLLGHYDQAASDYQGAVDAGRQDVNVLWNAGWNAYIMGDYPRSVVYTKAALAQSPDQIALHFNLALAQLAAGQLDEANASYALGISTAEDQVSAARAEGQEPPVSLWWYLDTAVVDLRNLVQCIESEACGGAPAQEVLVIDPQSSPIVLGLQHTLQSLAVSLEYPDHVVDTENDPQNEPQIDALAFTTAVYDAAGTVVSYLPLGDSAAPLRFGMVQESQGVAQDTSMVRANSAANRDVFVNFHYDSITNDQLIVMKVYLNDREASGLRLALPWTLGKDGDASLPLSPGRTFTLASGDYRVDFFVDGRFVQTGEFQIDP
ncbi:MAG: tetratricopeptide repeat protein [Caldilineaceae bacterium]|nr:tetratricopeptide repeat protein [Caldilineaceae bacterium]MBP8109705.1 tetratricopeptide repeat protein [Caldilineaceae bacterium]MBP8125476.1 tetratricopeptide repeat protein [Caldilineaceae bacterium]MBP9070720.1 tetratricopeptide repeat protein [Caldilineaceae bacterium]